MTATDTGALYDEVCYPSVPFSQTHPERLAVLATLFGMQPAPVERCRVLELGANDGSNLIPMALGLPGSTFLGIDLSGSAVARGQETIRQLGLTNVALHQLDIRDLAGQADPPAPFDYVIAHGVYSWVPPDVREAILTICQRWLAPHGVAYLSFNAYPGSYLRDAIREMLLYHAGGPENGAVTVARAQGLARLLADAIPSTEHATSLRAALSAVAIRHPGALFHDELAPHHQAFSFHEVAGRAAAHGLQYLAEASFPEMHDGAFPASVREILTAIEAERGRIAREQYLDFLRVRRFRQTLLCRAEVTLPRAPTGAALRSLRVAAPLRLDPEAAELDLRPGVVQTFRGPSEASVQLDLPLAKAAFSVLGESWPDRLTFGTLVERARQQLPDPPDPDAAAQLLADVCLNAYAGGIVQVHAYRPLFVLEPGARPMLSPLALLQARRDDSSPITTLLHEHVVIDDPFAHHTLRLLDGTRDWPTLVAELRAWIRAQPDEGAARPLPAESEITLQALSAKLHQLARLGLLVA